MIPVIHVSVNGQDVSSGVAGRLISGEVVLHQGGHADQATLVLSNWDGRLAKPPRGGMMEVSAGFADSGVASLGQYIISDVTKLGPVATFHVCGHAADLKQGLKQQRMRSFQQQTLGTILSTIAGENALMPALDATLAAITIPLLVQAHESDLHLITRLARQHGALGSIKAGRLVFVPRGAGTSASGASLPPIIVRPEDLEGEFSLSASDRPKRGTVKAHHFDRGKGARVLHQANGTGDGPDYFLPHLHGSDDQADKACAARAKDFKAQKRRFEGTFKSGLNAAIPGVPLMSAGFGDDDDRSWIIKTTSHHFGPGGYVTHFTAEGH